MPGLADYLENAVLNYIKGIAFPAVAGAFVALFNGDPTDAGTGGAEVTTTVRTAGRVAVTFGALGDGTMSNNAAVDFGNAAGAATVTHFAIFSAASGGNMLMSGPITAGTVNIAAAAPVSFPVGSLTLTIS